MSGVAFCSLFGADMLASEIVEIDLSIFNQSKEFRNIDNFDHLTSYIQKFIENRGAKYAIGGYGEKRNLYERFSHFNEAKSKRDIHLGIDIWAPVETPIFLPFDGICLTSTVIDLPGDYGGLLIFKHEIGQETIHSLYGHLAHKSTMLFEKGQEVKAGTHIGWLGDFNENGNWPPHLHFQLIKDLNGLVGNYPGVSSEEDKEYYLNNCPNPMSWINLRDC